MKALVERDDTALAQLNDDELQALAEQVQLQEEIEQPPGTSGVSGSWFKLMLPFALSTVCQRFKVYLRGLEFK